MLLKKWPKLISGEKSTGLASTSDSNAEDVISLMNQFQHQLYTGQLSDNFDSDVLLQKHWQCFCWIKALVRHQTNRYDQAKKEFEFIPYDQLPPALRAYAYLDGAATFTNLNQSVEAENWLALAAQNIHLADCASIAPALLQARKGFLTFSLGEYDSAILSLNAALLQFESQPALRTQDFYVLGNVYLHLGHLAVFANDSATVIQYFELAAALAQQFQLPQIESRAYLFLGSFYYQSGQLENAKQYFHNCIQLAPSSLSALDGQANFAQLLHFEGQNALALEQIEALAIKYEKFGLDQPALQCRIGLLKAKIFIGLQHNANAIVQLKRVAAIVPELTSEQQKATFQHELSLSYARLNNPATAFEHLAAAYVAQGLAAKIRDAQRLEWLNYEHKKQLDRKENERLLQETVLLRQQILRAQMSPHFISNVLSAIQAIVMEKDNIKSTKAIHQFNSLLRTLLEISEFEWVTLEHEIAFLKEYLEVNRDLRFRGQFSYTLIIDEDVEEDIMYVPAMIVQPFVENAIEHGIRSLPNGTIEIRFSMTPEEQVICTVTDNGIGRKASAAQKVGSKHNSKGLDITRQRLQILSADPNYDFDFKDLYHPNGQPSGTQVRILLPMKLH